MSGSATVTVSISDDGGTADGGVDTSADQTFTITVTGVNDRARLQRRSRRRPSMRTAAPTRSPGGPPPSPPVPRRGAAGAGSDVHHRRQRQCAAVLGRPRVDPATGDLTFTLAADDHGTANIQLRLLDDGGTADGGDDTSPVQPFKITVDPVNDAPSFTKGADQNVLSDSGAHSIVGWATAISPGPANESGQSVSFNTTGNTNPGLFSAPPLVASTGTLVFTPAAGQFGTATITIEAAGRRRHRQRRHRHVASQTFDITVGKPTVVITEFRPDGPGGADDEFVEIFNAGSVARDLTGWKLHITSGLDFDFYTFPAVTLQPGPALPGNAHSSSPRRAWPTARGPAVAYRHRPRGRAGSHRFTGPRSMPSTTASDPRSVKEPRSRGWVGPQRLDASWERLYGDTFGNCIDTDDNAVRLRSQLRHEHPAEHGLTAHPVRHASSRRQRDHQ